MNIRHFLRIVVIVDFFLANCLKLLLKGVQKLWKSNSPFAFRFFHGKWPWITIRLATEKWEFHFTNKKWKYEIPKEPREIENSKCIMACHDCVKTLVSSLCYKLKTAFDWHVIVFSLVFWIIPRNMITLFVTSNYCTFTWIGLPNVTYYVNIL